MLRKWHKMSIRKRTFWTWSKLKCVIKLKLILCNKVNARNWNRIVLEYQSSSHEAKLLSNGAAVKVAQLLKLDSSKVWKWFELYFALFSRISSVSTFSVRSKALKPSRVLWFLALLVSMNVSQVPCSWSSSPLVLKHSLNLWWWKSWISGDWRNGRWSPQCSKIVVVKMKQLKQMADARSSRRMIKPAIVGRMLHSTCSSGWQYWLATAIGAVHSWWTLWTCL